MNEDDGTPDLPRVLDSISITTAVPGSEDPAGERRPPGAGIAGRLRPVGVADFRGMLGLEVVEGPGGVDLEYRRRTPPTILQGRRRPFDRPTAPTPPDPEVREETTVVEREVREETVVEREVQEETTVVEREVRETPTVVHRHVHQLPSVVDRRPGTDRSAGDAPATPAPGPRVRMEFREPPTPERAAPDRPGRDAPAPGRESAPGSDAPDATGDVRPERGPPGPPGRIDRLVDDPETGPAPTPEPETVVETTTDPRPPPGRTPDSGGIPGVGEGAATGRQTGGEGADRRGGRSAPWSAGGASTGRPPAVTGEAADRGGGAPRGPSSGRPAAGRDLPVLRMRSPEPSRPELSPDVPPGRDPTRGAASGEPRPTDASAASRPGEGSPGAHPTDPDASDRRPSRTRSPVRPEVPHGTDRGASGSAAGPPASGTGGIRTGTSGRAGPETREAGDPGDAGGPTAVDRRPGRDVTVLGTGAASSVGSPGGSAGGRDPATGGRATRDVPVLRTRSPPVPSAPPDPRVPGRAPGATGPSPDRSLPSRTDRRPGDRTDPGGRRPSEPAARSDPDSPSSGRERAPATAVRPETPSRTGGVRLRHGDPASAGGAGDRASAARGTGRRGAPGGTPGDRSPGSAAGEAGLAVDAGPATDAGRAADATAGGRSPPSAGGASGRDVTVLRLGSGAGGTEPGGAPGTPAGRAGVRTPGRATPGGGRVGRDLPVLRTRSPPPPASRPGAEGRPPGSTGRRPEPPAARDADAAGADRAREPAAPGGEPPESTAPSTDPGGRDRSGPSRGPDPRAGASTRPTAPSPGRGGADEPRERPRTGGLRIRHGTPGTARSPVGESGGRTEGPGVATGSAVDAGGRGPDRDVAVLVSSGADRGRVARTGATVSTPGSRAGWDPAGGRRAGPAGRESTDRAARTGGVGRGVQHVFRRPAPPSPAVDTVGPAGDLPAPERGSPDAGVDRPAPDDGRQFGPVPDAGSAEGGDRPTVRGVGSERVVGTGTDPGTTVLDRVVADRSYARSAAGGRGTTAGTTGIGETGAGGGEAASGRGAAGDRPGGPAVGSPGTVRRTFATAGTGGLDRVVVDRAYDRLPTADDGPGAAAADVPGPTDAGEGIPGPGAPVDAGGPDGGRAGPGPAPVRTTLARLPDRSPDPDVVPARQRGDEGGPGSVAAGVDAGVPTAGSDAGVVPSARPTLPERRRGARSARARARPSDTPGGTARGRGSRAGRTAPRRVNRVLASRVHGRDPESRTDSPGGRAERSRPDRPTSGRDDGATGSAGTDDGRSGSAGTDGPSIGRIATGHEGLSDRTVSRLVGSAAGRSGGPGAAPTVLATGPVAAASAAADAAPGDGGADIPELQQPMEQSTPGSDVGQDRIGSLSTMPSMTLRSGGSSADGFELPGETVSPGGQPGPTTGLGDSYPEFNFDRRSTTGGTADSAEADEDGADASTSTPSSGPAGDTMQSAAGDREAVDPGPSAVDKLLSPSGPELLSYDADVDRVVDRLYRELERKMRIERERRGL